MSLPRGRNLCRTKPEVEQIPIVGFLDFRLHLFEFGHVTVMPGYPGELFPASGSFASRWGGLGICGPRIDGWVARQCAQ